MVKSSSYTVFRSIFNRSAASNQAGYNRRPAEFRPLGTSKLYLVLIGPIKTPRSKIRALATAEAKSRHHDPGEDIQDPKIIIAWKVPIMCLLELIRVIQKVLYLYYGSTLRQGLRIRSCMELLEQA